MTRVDLTVFGAGVFGLSVAWHALSLGARVRVIDPSGPGGGASGGIVGALAPHIPNPWNEKKEFQYHSLLMSQVFWSKIEAQSGLSTGYKRSGRLQPLNDARAVALAEDRVTGAKTNWKGHAVWRVRPRQDTPWEPQSPTGMVIEDTLSALIYPRRAVASLAAAIRESGGEIVKTGAKEGLVCHATGWRGLMDIEQALGRRFGNGVKGQAALLDYDARGCPQLFVGGLHILPHDDGTVAIGSTSERDFDAPDTTDAQVDVLVETAKAALPILEEAAVICRWAGVRPRAQSRAPVLGPHPIFPGEFIANGGFKIGFGMAPKVGEVMAELMLNGHDRIPASFRSIAG